MSLAPVAREERVGTEAVVIRHPPAASSTDREGRYSKILRPLAWRRSREMER
jgi:hypothetical protein